MIAPFLLAATSQPTYAEVWRRELVIESQAYVLSAEVDYRGHPRIDEYYKWGASRLLLRRPDGSVAGEFAYKQHGMSISAPGVGTTGPTFMPELNQPIDERTEGIVPRLVATTHGWTLLSPTRSEDWRTIWTELVVLNVSDKGFTKLLTVRNYDEVAWLADKSILVVADQEWDGIHGHPSSNLLGHVISRWKLDNGQFQKLANMKVPLSEDLSEGIPFLAHWLKVPPRTLTWGMTPSGYF